MIEDIEKQVAEWHQETFPNATNGAVYHKLYEEVQELKDELVCYLHYGKGPKDIPAEIADVAIVSIALLARYGTTLSAVIAAKLAVNKTRVWGADGTRVK